MAKTSCPGPDAGSGLETHGANEALQVESLVRHWRIGSVEQGRMESGPGRGRCRHFQVE